MPRPFPPAGWTDLLRQIVLFCGAYWLYRLVRGQGLGTFFEPALHAWATSQGWIADFASWMYVNSHFAITTAALAFLYLRRNARFYFVRNMLMVAMAIALAGYAVFPTAPPRFLPELGFRDSVAAFAGVEAEAANVLFNPYAAVPSMHVAFALMLGLPLACMARHRWARVLWRGYPALVTFVVIATANHGWLDAFLEAATAAAAALAANGVLARARPEAWAWAPARWGSVI